MNSFLDYILARLSERSTWVGLTTFATAVGIGLSPEQAQAIGTAGAALASAILVFTKDAPR